MLAFALSACAPPRPEEREIGVRHQDLAGDVEWRLQVQSSLVTHHVDAPVEQVWAVLPGIYEELEVPLTDYDAEGLTLGNRQFVPRRIGGQRMSRYLDCGGPSSGRPFADAYQVEMEPTSPPVNAILTVVGWLEAALLRFARLPFGTSIICIAGKEPSPDVTTIGA